MKQIKESSQSLLYNLYIVEVRVRGKRHQYIIAHQNYQIRLCTVTHIDPQSTILTPSQDGMIVECCGKERLSYKLQVLSLPPPYEARHCSIH